MQVHISWLLFIVFPSWFMTEEKCCPGDDPVHYLDGGADHCREAQRTDVQHDGEQAEKRGLPGYNWKKSIINMICNNWMQKKKRKTETFILLLLPLNGLSRKKKYPRRLNVFNLLTQDTREWHRAASGDGQVGNWEKVPPCGRHGTGCPGWWAQPHAARALGVLGHHS